MLCKAYVNRTNETYIENLIWNLKKNEKWVEMHSISFAKLFMSIQDQKVKVLMLENFEIMVNRIENLDSIREVTACLKTLKGQEKKITSSIQQNIKKIILRSSNTLEIKNKLIKELNT